MDTAPGSVGTPFDAPREHPLFDTAADAADYVITAAASCAGLSIGEMFQDPDQLAVLVAATFDTLSRGLSDPSPMTLASAPPQDWAGAYSNITRTMIASLRISHKHDFVMAGQHDWATIEKACDERRLPGGTLTPSPTDSTTAAAGTPGWCAPCEVRYDFCPPAVIDGIVDLPTVIATRGCLTFPTMPDFGLIYSQLGFCYPAADYDLATPPVGTPAAPNDFWAKNKPCTPVPCPETQTCTLDPCGVCLQSSILVERAYPELIQYFMSNALVAWGHRMNCRDISQMIERSIPVNVPADHTGPGATASVLEVMEFYATWLRYRYRLGKDASIEAVLPEWMRAVIRTDLSKRLGIDFLALTDQMVDNWFSIRKVRVQWVLGLDEAYCDTGDSPPAP